MKILKSYLEIQRILKFCAFFGAGTYYYTGLRTNRYDIRAEKEGSISFLGKSSDPKQDPLSKLCHIPFSGMVWTYHSENLNILVVKLRE